MSSILQFAPLQSFVSPTFWHKLAEVKLNHDRLSDAPKPIFGFYTNRSAKACLVEVDYSAFSSDFKVPKFCHVAVGTLYNKNTIEEFKALDKNNLLMEEGEKLLRDFKEGRILEDPSRLGRFFVLSFADLAHHNYYFWFAFPCPLTPTLSALGAAQKLQNIPDIQHFNELITRVPAEQQNFFVLKGSDSEHFYALKDFFDVDNLAATQWDDVYFCFADASEYEHPSWLMRTYAAFLFYKCPFLVGKKIKFLGVRYNNQQQPGNSLVWEVVQKEIVNLTDAATVNFVGWELNRNGKMGPRLVSMKDSMDPKILVENAIILNLKLMKWRLVPDLNLEVMFNAKCLLFGAGTLGCNVARNLLSWGFKHITLVDNGLVHFSNPLRQNLYSHADALAGNVMKAKIAAERLREIHPSATTTGHVIQIPMPGHTIGASLQQQTMEDLNKIRELVEEHDVIFLLTDSRESRWLPTLLGATFNKLVINAALGFDSYLVMRHGISSSSPTEGSGQSVDIGDLKCIDGADLGCYFCNDVTAPGNSMKDRTLDQQCTVTRPGVSNIAASYAVELVVALLQHPQRERAPAFYCPTSKPNTKVPEGLLGIIPHSIRGMLCNFENILPATRKFSQCIACSEKVIAEYHKEGNAFLFKAFETAKYLEDLTGISDFKELDSKIIDFDDSDLEEMSDE